MKDLRITKERRSFKPAPRFPFDRRRVPDQRLNNICDELFAMIKTES